MQDLFNEWHAKNTSQKVRNVFKNKGMAGIPLTTNPPFGYMKNPENPKEWLIDEPAAKIVRQIFELCVSGLGPTQIAKKLKTDKVMTPTEYWNSIGRNCGNPPARQFNWCSDTVANILSKQEYCGDTVNFRSTTKSFKNKKKIERPQEEWQIFPNTHPAIIDRETFELVQELRQHRRRPTKSGIVSMFSGLLYCADCGSKLHFATGKNMTPQQDCYRCSRYKSNTGDCTMHFIREETLKLFVLQRIFDVTALFFDDAMAFEEAAKKQHFQEAEKDAKKYTREIAQAEKRNESMRQTSMGQSAMNSS